MAERVIAIGDVHGCSRALQVLLDLIDPRPQDVVVTLGDYVNRGPDGKGVLDQLMRLNERCTLVPLLGNHDEMLLSNRMARTELPTPPGSLNEHFAPDDFGASLERFREEHFDFLGTCRPYYEIDTHFFVHANYQPSVPLEDQDRYTLLWLSLWDYMPPRHCSGKTAILGHTSQKDGEILDRPHLKCIDTYCHGGGWLTALDVRRGTQWQVSNTGKARN